jgi:hypothetical protein
MQTTPMYEKSTTIVLHGSGNDRRYSVTLGTQGTLNECLLGTTFSEFERLDILSVMLSIIQSS